MPALPLNGGMTNHQQQPTRAEVLDALTYDGDTIDISAGATIRLECGPDPYMSGFDFINDYDCYGRVAWPVRNRETGRDSRPVDFDGSAILLGVGRSYDRIWWLPYREGHKVYNDDANRAIVQALLEDGPQYVALWLDTVCECCEQRVHTVIESLSGIDSLDNGYLATVIDELLPTDLTSLTETTES